ncbi:MAG: protein tyrosine phosphatase family protein, partial [Planctomycetota bacterium]
MKTTTWILATAALLAGCAGTVEETTPSTTATAYEPSLEPWSCEGVDRVHNFESVFLASQPDGPALEKASKNGIRTVVNLRMPSENGESERTSVEGLGMKYVNVPFDKEHLSDEAVDGVLRVLQDPVNHPVMIHCSSSNRVGMVWMALRATRDGM